MVTIVDALTQVDPADGTAKYVIEADAISELRSKDAANMVINDASAKGLSKAGISQLGPSAYPVDGSGQPIHDLNGGKPAKYRMDVELRCSR